MGLEGTAANKRGSWGPRPLHGPDESCIPNKHLSADDTSADAQQRSVCVHAVVVRHRSSLAPGRLPVPDMQRPAPPR